MVVFHFGIVLSFFFFLFDFVVVNFGACCANSLLICMLAGLFLHWININIVLYLKKHNKLPATPNYFSKREERKER